MTELWASNTNPMPGETITICVTIEWMHYGQVDVTITNSTTGQAENHVVDLDYDGRGCFTWQVPPGWVAAVVENYATADLAIVIG